jgi:PLP dependent protein
MSTSVSANLAQVRKRIELACQAVGRASDTVKLLAVSKTMPAQAVREAYAAGQLAFGENYIQEGVDKIAALADLPLGVALHWPDSKQQNQAGGRKLCVGAQHRPLENCRAFVCAKTRRTCPPLQVCLQVNVDGGSNKSGVAPEELLGLGASRCQVPAPAIARHHDHS